MIEPGARQNFPGQQSTLGLGIGAACLTAMEDEISTSSVTTPLALDESIQETLTEVAFKPRASESALLSSLAENLAASGKGFALLDFQTREQSLRVRSVFAPDGTSYLQDSPDSTSEEYHVVLAVGVSEMLDQGEVLFFDSLDSILVDQASTPLNILKRALKDCPLLAVRLNHGQENEYLFLLAGTDLDPAHVEGMKRIANRLSLAMEIVRLKLNLKTAEAKHDWMFQASEVALLLINPRDIVEELNAKAIQFLGLARDEILNQQITQLIPDSYEWYEDQRRKVQDSDRSSLEFEFVMQNLGLRHLRLELLSLSHAEQGSKLLRITDLSEIWRLEEMVRRLDHMKDGMAEHMSVGMILQDAHGNFAHVNQAAAQMLGYEEEELLGEHWTLIYPEDQHPLIRKTDMRRIWGASDRYEIQMLHKSGKRLDVLVSDNPYEENGCFAGTFTFITDLTDLRQAEAKVLQKNRDLERALERITALNQAASGALHSIDAETMMKAVGDELHQLRMSCLIATLDSLHQNWFVRHSTASIEVISAGGRVFHVGESFRLPAETNSAWANLLQSGDTLFLEGARNALEGLMPIQAPLEVEMNGFDKGPRILAPLTAGERMFGVLIVCGEDLSQEDVPAITAFSNHLSIALEKARLLENTMTQAKLGQVLAEIAAAASNELDMARLLEVTGHLMLRALEIPCCSFSAYDETTETVSTLMSISDPQSAPDWNLPLPGSTVELESNPAVRRVLSSGTIIWLQGSQGARIQDDAQGPPPLQVMVPMAVSGKVSGLGTFYLDQPDRKLTPDEMIFLQTGMEQISMALENVRLAAEAEIQDQIERSLAKLVERTLASRDMNEVVVAALDGISALIPCNLVSLISFDFEANTAQILGIRGGKNQILDEGQIVELNDWQSSPEYAMRSEIVVWGKEDIHTTESLGGKLLQHGIASWATVPLNVQDEVIGNLFIGAREPEGFGSEHIAVAKRFANHLAVALANAGNYESAQRRASELTALYDLAMDIAGELELRPLLKKSLRRATELLGTMMAAVYLVDPAIDQITLIADYHLPEPPSILNLKLGQGLAGKVWEEAQPVALAQTRMLGDPQWLESCYASGAALGVPLLWEGEVRGVLTVFEPSTSRKFNSDEALLLERMAAQISLGIENVEKHEQINRRVNQLRVVNDVARRINILLDQEQLFNEVVQRVAHSLNLELVVLFLVDGDLLVEKASYYLPDDRHGSWAPLQLKIGAKGISGEAARNGNPILVPNVSKSSDYIRVLPFERKVRSAAAIPLKLKGEVVGVLLAESERLAAFDQTDVDALQALGAHISTSTENARLYAEMMRVRNKMTESEKLRSLGLMTSGIAHDFNNLLSIILARAELALEQIVDEQVRAHLEQVIASARDGGETIHRLQDFARTRTDTSDFVGVDLNQIVEQAIELSQPKWKDQAQSQGVDIDITTDYQASEIVHGAGAQLREVMVNLIFNAVEAMQEDGTIKIRTSSNEYGAELRITDTGSGMTQEVKDQIFVPFFTTKHSGTGLGLSMVYGVMQRHGGRVDIISSPGGGTTVSLLFPHSSIPEDDPQPEQYLDEIDSLDSVSILVVEDEDPIREGLVQAFTGAGHHVLEASNGAEGLELFFKAEKLDVVFTDLGMPRLSGWELIEQLHIHNSSLPVVILSGWGQEVNPEMVEKYGIAKVIAKPFSIVELRMALHEIISLKK